MKSLKFTLLLLTITSAQFSWAQKLGNCGPGTADPKCDVHNAQLRANRENQQQQRAIDASKRDGTYGRTGEQKTPNSAINNQGRPGGTIPR